ncbi:hypothetical protein [Rhizobium rhizoryzae]|uniref:Uncharacterized protein n=1 Tax=Rhizobium rhizoryzae TaxID=451876 RepID=A0A7W6PTA8_9HYPH|nr:hypothetical protein [Rhizobium rhizoryzae]MBB4145859.1 hypothetical protein [Rhizobium rhizoryzae]
MEQHYRLYIVTDTPERAAEYFFGHGLALVPSWTKIVSKIDEIAAIPDGARAVGVWFVPFDLRNERWILRRCEVNIIGDHFEVLDAIRQWQAKSATAPAEQVIDHQPETLAPSPEVEPEAPAPQPPPAIPAMQQPAAPRWK